MNGAIIHTHFVSVSISIRIYNDDINNLSNCIKIHFAASTSVVCGLATHVAISPGSRKRLPALGTSSSEVTSTCRPADLRKTPTRNAAEMAEARRTTGDRSVMHRVSLPLECSAIAGQEVVKRLTIVAHLCLRSTPEAGISRRQVVRDASRYRDRVGPRTRRAPRGDRPAPAPRPALAPCRPLATGKRR